MLVGCERVHLLAWAQASAPRMNLSLPTLLAYGLYAAIGIAGLWLAVQAWRRFGITTFLWIVTVRVVAAVHTMLFSFQFPADKVKLALKRIDSHVEHSPGEMVVSVATSTSTPVLLSSVCLIAIAAGEFAEIGERMDNSFKSNAAFRWCFRKRIWLGFIAVLLAMVPEIALAVWLWSGNN